MSSEAGSVVAFVVSGDNRPRDDIPPAQPAVEVQIRTTRRAERQVRGRSRLFADRTFSFGHAAPTSSRSRGKDGFEEMTNRAPI